MSKNLINELKFADILKKSADKRAPIAKQFQINARFMSIDPETLIITFNTQDFGPQGSRRIHTTEFQINERLDKVKFRKGLELYRIQNNLPALRSYLINGYFLNGNTNYYCSCECFTGETLIKMLDGTDKRIDEFVQGEEYWIYSSDENGNFIPKKAQALGVTKIVNQIVEVTLDNGKVEKCSLNHQWRLRDGTYKAAKDLQSGDSLMPVDIININVKLIKIVDVEDTPLYDLSVPDTNNFALASGVYVHNSFIFGGFKFLSTKLKSNIEGQEENRRPVKTNPMLYGASCFTGDTKIKMLDGTDRCIDSLTPGSEYYVFGSKLDGKIEPVKATALGVTKYVNEITEVTLDNGETIRCTPEHRFMLRNGEYCEASSLSAGISLMPLYTRLNNFGYSEYFDNMTMKWDKVHQSVAYKFIKTISETWTDIKESNKNDRFLVVHHIDFNKLNNSPENLKWMGEHDHWIYHASLTAASMERLNIFRKSEAGQAHNKETGVKLKEKWNDEEFRKKKTEHNKYLAQNKTEYQKQRISESAKNTMTKFHADPEFQERAKKRSSINLKKKWQDPTFAKKMEEKARKETTVRNRDPEFQKKCRIAGIFKSFEKIKSMGFEITEETYKTYRESYSVKAVTNYFNTFTEAVEAFNCKNHKVVGIRTIALNIAIPVYDISVPETENFALSSGVIVHNCKHVAGTIQNINVFKEPILRALQQNLKLMHPVSNTPLDVPLPGAQARQQARRNKKHHRHEDIPWTTLDVNLDTWDEKQWREQLMKWNENNE